MVTVSSLVLILPLCFAKTIDFLKYASGVATVGVFYLVFVTIFVFYSVDTSNVVLKTRPDSWTQVFTVIPAICFGYQCHVSVIPVYSCIRPRSLWNFGKTVSVALTVCFVSYTLVGIYGYLTFGSAVEQDLLSSFSTSKPVVLIAYVIFAIKTFLTYPILLFCGRIAFESMLDEFRPVSSVLEEKRRRLALGSIWFFSSLLVAVFVPNITVVIDYLGSMAAAFIFVFPGLCLLNAVFLYEERIPGFRRNCGLIVASVYIVFGVFLLGLTLAQGVLYDTTLGRTKIHGLCN